jgi:hypothetical protein
MSAPSQSQLLKLRLEEAREIGKFYGDWQIEMHGESTSEGKDEGFASHLSADTNLSYRLAPWLSFRGSPYVDLYSARLQQRYEDEDYESRVGLHDSFVQIMPDPHFELRLGALGQGVLETPLMIGRNRNFPGAMEIGHLNINDKVEIDGILQQSIPTSHSLNIERDQREQLPTFQTQSLHLRAKPNDETELFAWAGHFRWKNLPAKVAAISQTLGNRPTGDDPASAKFGYGFDGYFGGLSACYCVHNSFGVAAGIERFANNLAPTERRNGQGLWLGPKYEEKFWSLKMTYTKFFVESDATPAYYNPARYGHNNRDGDSLEFKLNLKKYKFSIVGEYTSAAIILQDFNQQHLTTMFLGVETDYASF